ncbi:hypothetical protein I4F81_010223 [Pyropia yezoensis]|uniref:Uncharacterized protein n=1 Tax=Pyropia yezoensis TaxID=2788 RepID=A0ACC3CBV7_PYRYE|nr:hypothetical protein I4F81_010223 [Neopyropia yezoensis]
MQPPLRWAPPPPYLAAGLTPRDRPKRPRRHPPALVPPSPSGRRETVIASRPAAVVAGAQAPAPVAGAQAPAPFPLLPLQGQQSPPIKTNPHSAATAAGGRPLQTPPAQPARGPRTPAPPAPPPPQRRPTRLPPPPHPRPTPQPAPRSSPPSSPSPSPSPLSPPPPLPAYRWMTQSLPEQPPGVPPPPPLPSPQASLRCPPPPLSTWWGGGQVWNHPPQRPERCKYPPRRLPRGRSLPVIGIVDGGHLCSRGGHTQGTLQAPPFGGGAKSPCGGVVGGWGGGRSVRGRREPPIGGGGGEEAEDGRGRRGGGGGGQPRQPPDVGAWPRAGGNPPAEVVEDEARQREPPRHGGMGRGCSGEEGGI